MWESHVKKEIVSPYFCQAPWNSSLCSPNHSTKKKKKKKETTTTSTTTPQLTVQEDNSYQVHVPLECHINVEQPSPDILESVERIEQGLPLIQEEPQPVIQPTIYEDKIVEVPQTFTILKPVYKKEVRELIREVPKSPSSEHPYSPGYVMPSAPTETTRVLHREMTEPCFHTSVKTPPQQNGAQDSSDYPKKPMDSSLDPPHEMSMSYYPYSGPHPLASRDEKMCPLASMHPVPGYSPYPPPSFTTTPPPPLPPHISSSYPLPESLFFPNPHVCATTPLPSYPYADRCYPVNYCHSYYPQDGGGMHPPMPSQPPQPHPDTNHSWPLSQSQRPFSTREDKGETMKPTEALPPKSGLTRLTPITKPFSKKYHKNNHVDSSPLEVFIFSPKNTPSQISGHQDRTHSQPIASNVGSPHSTFSSSPPSITSPPYLPPHSFTQGNHSSQPPCYPPHSSQPPCYPPHSSQPPCYPPHPSQPPCYPPHPSQPPCYPPHPSYSPSYPTMPWMYYPPYSPVAYPGMPFNPYSLRVPPFPLPTWN